MKKAGRPRHDPEWKCNEGYIIDEETGLAKSCAHGLCTLHVYHAYPNDRLVVNCADYEYQVLIYGGRADEKYIYTYDYQQEENWAVYDPGEEGLVWRGLGEDFLFREECFFRVNLREKEILEETAFRRKENSRADKEETGKKKENSSQGEGCPLRWEQASRDWELSGGRKGSDESYRREAEKTIEQVHRVRGPGDLAFFLLTDTHYTVNGTWADTVESLRAVKEASAFTDGDSIDRLLSSQSSGDFQGVIHLGDATDGMVPREITRDYVRMMQEDLQGLGIPLYYTLGNHDSNYFRGNPEPFDRQEMYDLYLGGKPGHYFRDYEDKSLRLIFLESFDHREKVRYGYSDQELDWLEERLEEIPQDWYAVVFSHVPPAARLHYWSDQIRGSTRLVRVLRRFQHRSEGRLLGFIHGHNHADGIDCREGFPIISIGCSKCEYFTDKKPQGSVTWPRRLKDVSRELWDVLVVSTERRALDLIRFGAGKNRRVTVEFSRSLPQSLPEGLPQSLPAGSGIQNGSRDNVKNDRRSRRGNGGQKISGVIIRSWKDTETDISKTTIIDSEVLMTKVITYGTYDLFHEGHYNILKRARELGDYLIVGVTTEHYDQQRGKINVVDSLLDRIENVRKTELADLVIIEDHEGQKIEDIQKYQVDIFTLGSDWRGMFDYLKPLCQVVYLDRTPDISSTMLRKEKFPIVRTGIVGTGRIAPRFVAEAKYVSGLHMRSAYNPHKDSVQQFASEMGLEGFSESFEEFLDSVDAIYIATPHETHYDYAKRALLRGKHVMCEKPLAFSRREAEELFAIARENQVVLMEGIKTAYCPGFTQIINIAKSGKIGEIRDVEACFSRLTDPALREMADFQYGGAFLEFGSYTLLPIIKLLGADYKSLEINSIPAENGVDLYTKIMFSYEKGLAMSKTGIGVKSEGQLLISGTKGYILAESPWWLTRKFQIRYEDPTQIETYTPNFMGDGLRYEIGEFVSSINGHNGYSYRLTEQDSVAMAGVVEAFMEKRAQQQRSFREKNRASGVKIWAHRGCCYQYPENTLPAFEAACRIPGIAGIELDIQLSKDGEIMVFHDETLNRLMGVDGNLRDYTCRELQQMRFQAWDYEAPAETSRMYIPRMEEVLQLVKPYSASAGAMINIELKNGGVRYEGMEEKILALVKKYDMEAHVLYSSFNPESLRMLKELNAGVSTGILAGDVRECVRMEEDSLADALHPSAESILEHGAECGLGEDSGPESRPEPCSEEGGSFRERTSQAACRPVRGWNGREPFYKERRWPVQYDLCALAKKGMTDFITNVPEEYLRED